MVGCEYLDAGVASPESNVAVLGARNLIEAERTLATLTENCDVRYQALVDSAVSTSDFVWIEITHE